MIQKNNRHNDRQMASGILLIVIYQKTANTPSVTNTEFLNGHCGFLFVRYAGYGGF